MDEHGWANVDETGVILLNFLRSKIYWKDCFTRKNLSINIGRGVYEIVRFACSVVNPSVGDGSGSAIFSVSLTSLSVVKSESS